MSAVDMALHWDGPAHGRLEPVRARRGDQFAWRVLLRSTEDADDGFFGLLAAALGQNS